MLVKDGVAYLQAGGGIVFDSDPYDEWMETINKLGGYFSFPTFPADCLQAGKVLKRSSRRKYAVHNVGRAETVC